MLQQALSLNVKFIVSALCLSLDLDQPESGVLRFKIGYDSIDHDFLPTVAGSFVLKFFHCFLGHGRRTEYVYAAALPLATNRAVYTPRIECLKSYLQELWIPDKKLTIDLMY